MEVFHYILTRFNLKLWREDRQHQSTRSEAWLEKRFQLFETYCLPSICNQVFKDFTWIVLFDESTPDIYQKKIEAYKAVLPAFKPVVVPSSVGIHFVGAFQKAVIKDLLLKTSTLDHCVVSTTYLDNDDALSADFMKAVSDHTCEYSRDTFITMHDGLQYFEDLQIANHVKYKNNHFITLIESISGDEPIRTVYGYGSHGNVYRHPHCDVIGIKTKKPYWVEVVHDTNAKNNVILHRWTSLATDRTILRRDFGLDIELRKDGWKVFYTTFAMRWMKAHMTYLKVKLNDLWGR